MGHALRRRGDRFRIRWQRDRIAPGREGVFGRGARGRAAFADDEFPKTSWDARRFLRAPALRCFGIQRITMLRNVLVLAGVGVGGFGGPWPNPGCTSSTAPPSRPTSGSTRR
jgi:hypothetical protein